MLNLLKLILKFFKTYLIGNLREENLALYFSNLITENTKSDEIKIIDFGSGYDPSVISNLQNILLSKNKKLKIKCYDFYTKKQIEELQIKFKDIEFFNLKI